MVDTKYVAFDFKRHNAWRNRAAHVTLVGPYKTRLRGSGPHLC